MESKALTRKYHFGGYPFIQKVLTYMEFEEAVALSSDFLGDLETIGSLGAALNRILKSSMLPRLVKIVVKPHFRTIVHRAYYALKRRIFKVDLSNPITVMDIEDVSEVLRDFFSINTNSLSNLTLIENQSAFFQLLKNPQAKSSPQKK